MSTKVRSCLKTTNLVETFDKACLDGTLNGELPIPLNLSRIFYMSCQVLTLLLLLSMWKTVLLFLDEILGVLMNELSAEACSEKEWLTL